MLRLLLCISLLLGTYGLNPPNKIRTLARENYKLVHYFSKPYICLLYTSDAADE